MKTIITTLSTSVAILSAVATNANASLFSFKQQGQVIGARNGAIIAERVKQKTIGQWGCDGLSEFEYALKNVTATIRPTQMSNTDFVHGFYNGYLGAISKSIRQVRQECNSLSYSSGSYVGELFSTAACSLATSSSSALDDYSFTPLYAGWSGHDEQVQSSCQSAFQVELSLCETSVDSSLATTLSLSACSDSALN